jgi:phosphatidylserine/phosphatidylglycerophosphate/cardiolipin synthase-like enzyme
MKLIVQPEDGVGPVLKAIKRARRSIDVLIFRLDNDEIAKALESAVARGVDVRALTAHTNSGGNKKLRKLELELLKGGVTVSRTADDFVRYHGKMMIVDNTWLHVYGFNFTRLDMGKSRSFGITTRNRKLVREAVKLFEADFNRQPYTPSCNRFIVSPVNARERLARFLGGAHKELLIYDPQLCDDDIMEVITARIKAGVSVKIIGKVENKWDVNAEKYPGRRLHVRTIVRDGAKAFIGSQSLRRLELDKRREIGIIVNDRKVVNAIKDVFERDWAETDSGRKEAKKAAKKEEKASLAKAS